MKDLGAKAFSYGYASPVLMAATYNDDGTVNVMNLHEVARTNAGDLSVLFIYKAEIRPFNSTWSFHLWSGCSLLSKIYYFK